MEMGGGVSQLKRLNALWAVGFLLDNLHHAREGGELAASFSFRHIKKGVAGVFVLLF